MRANMLGNPLKSKYLQYSILVTDKALGGIVSTYVPEHVILEYPIKMGIGVRLCVAGALSKGHRGRNVKAAPGASMVLMD